MTFNKSANLTLHPHQTRWLHCEGNEVLVGGAAGPGKSHFMRVAAIYWATQIPGLQIYLFRRTFPDLYSNHLTGPTSFLSMLAPLIESKHVKFDSRNNVFKFWNKAEIHLGHCQYARDWVKFQGSEMHVLMIDELTHWDKETYENLKTRVRMTNIELNSKWNGRFPKIICATNPGGIGHNWVKNHWVDAGPPGELIFTPIEQGGWVKQFLPARLEDNPTMLRDDPNYANRLKSGGNEARTRALLEGDWNIVSGGMFDDVWDKDVHVIEPFKIPENWRIDRAYDYGSAKPWACCWFAESNGEAVTVNGKKRHYPKGTVFVIGELYGNHNGEPNKGDRKNPYEQAKAIKEMDEKIEAKYGVRVHDGPADSAIFDASIGESIADMMEQEDVTWEKADKSQGSRKNGWTKMRAMLSAAKQHPMEEPGLIVFKTCHNFIRTIPILPRDEHEQDDVDTEAEDHIGDLTRYRVTAKSTGAHTIRLPGF